MEKPMTSRKTPQTDAIQELARFWDTHDLPDFEDHREEVTEPVFERNTAVEGHLAPKEMEAVHEMAKSKGVGSVELSRQWILETIQRC